MSFLKLSLFQLSLLILAILIIPSNAQNSVQDYLNGHNSARSQVGVGNIIWDTNLAAYAQTYANSRKDCQIIHSNGPYGENIAMGSNGFTGTMAVNMWVAEKAKYNYNSNSCVGGECLHYTQVVWKKSQLLGVLGFNATMDGGLFLATIILQAIGMERDLTSYLWKGFIFSTRVLY